MYTIEFFVMKLIDSISVPAALAILISLYVIHTRTFNQNKQLKVLRIHKGIADSSYFGFRHVQVYLCYYVTEAVLNSFV